ncbi:glycosyltransferase [Microbacterium sp. SLBN-146]|uniref:glycosyltransferase n=1 Tax=Microbacterium sp. SLBN-146 TaxID=2768457 RepID=UPI00135BB04C|nr:glycosyltransferase [Microbacterium sp. SLBN-146]
MSKNSGTVFYFRVEDPGYPRNARIRGYLARRRWDVRVHRRAARTRRFRALRDARAAFRGARTADVVVVSEISIPFVPVAWLAARMFRTPLAVDGFVSKYETDVEDGGRHDPKSFGARYRAFIDRFAVRKPDVYFVDTRVRRAQILRRYPDAHVLSLPVGAPAWARARAWKPVEDGMLRVLFYGSFLPLHGVPVIVRSLVFAPSVRLTLVGTEDHPGGTEDMRMLARELGVEERTRFLPTVPQEELADIIAAHDVVLGLFGGSAKAGSVIANKVWQGLACGRVVVTRESSALDELAPLAAGQLRTVPPGDSAALAASLEKIADSVGSLPWHEWSKTAERLERYVDSEFAALDTALTDRRAGWSVRPRIGLR